MYCLQSYQTAIFRPVENSRNALCVPGAASRLLSAITVKLFLPHIQMILLFSIGLFKATVIETAFRYQAFSAWSKAPVISPIAFPTGIFAKD